MTSPNISPSSDLDQGATWFARGGQLLESRNVERALECFYVAQRRGFDTGECAAARWDCWMLLGRFEAAWQESDLISALGRDPERMWNGESWAGKRVMLRCLHGLGDTIQFIRYAPLIKSICRSLVVQTHPQLVRLVQTVSGIDRVITWGDGIAEEQAVWDVQLEVTELPRAFRTTLTDIPLAIPYIHVPQERVRWAARLFRERTHLRIGIAWEAGEWNPSRSVALDNFAPLFACPHCEFYVLQKGASNERFQQWENVHELESYAADVLDTAALILNLDLVITVDTMTAHLAGALGQPVWIMLPAISDWRWMLKRRDTPWYPSARLFRQDGEVDWSATINDIRGELMNFQAPPRRPDYR